MNPETQNQTIDQGRETPAQTVEKSKIQTSAASRNNQLNAPSDTGVYNIELKYRSAKNLSSAKLARGLGLFSIALGLAEVLAPSRLAEMIGVGARHQKFLPALGLREIAHGVGILLQAKPTGAVWTRVGGDAIDLAFLGSAFASDETNKTRLTGATAAVLGVAALDLLCAQQLSNQNWQESDAGGITPTNVGQSSARHAANA
jgi:hypothetical protein